MRNPCNECDYYHKENNTCQSKKCCTGGDGTVTIIDRMFCSPYKYEADRKTEQADRPQGEWFKDDDGTFICSACGSGYKDQPTLMGKPLFKWCPLCGAKMKGADDESVDR